MREKTRQRPEKRSAPPAFKGFINYPLSPEEQKTLKGMGVDHERLWDTFASASESGWAVKFSHDFYNHCEQATLMMTDSGNVNAGWFLSGRGSTPMKAFRQALYIADVIDWSLADYGERNRTPKQEIDD